MLNRICDVWSALTRITVYLFLSVGYASYKGLQQLTLVVAIIAAANLPSDEGLSYGIRPSPRVN